MAFDRFGWNLQKQFGQMAGGECLLVTWRRCGNNPSGTQTAFSYWKRPFC